MVIFWQKLIYALYTRGLRMLLFTKLVGFVKNGQLCSL